MSILAFDLDWYCGSDSRTDEVTSESSSLNLVPVLLASQLLMP